MLNRTSLPARLFKLIPILLLVLSVSSTSTLQATTIPLPDSLPASLNLSAAGSLMLNTGENNAWPIVIDTANGYAYVGTDTLPGRIVKIRLASFSRVGAITLNAGENELSSAVIDTANGFAYFGTVTSPGKVIKIRLDNFFRVDAITFDAGEDLLQWGAVIDPGGGFAYFATSTSPSKVVKVRLSDFTRVGAVTFNTGEESLSAAAIDPAAGYAYFGTDTAPAKVVKVRLSDFTRVGALGFNIGENAAYSAVIDPAHGYAYFANLVSPGIIKRLNLENTRTVVVSSVNPSAAGQSVTFTATVTSVTGIGAPTGTVQFQVDGANLGPPVSLSGATASLSTASLTPGTHAITALYNGDASFNPSVGALSGGQVVSGRLYLPLVLR